MAIYCPQLWRADTLIVHELTTMYVIEVDSVDIGDIFLKVEEALCINFIELAFS